MMVLAIYGEIRFINEYNLTFSRMEAPGHNLNKIEPFRDPRSRPAAIKSRKRFEDFAATISNIPDFIVTLSNTACLHK